MDELMNVMAIENLENEEHRQHVNNRRAPHDPFTELNDRQFINMFRLSKQLCQFVEDTLEPLTRPKLRATDLDVRTRVLAALRFYASGSYQLDVGSNKYLDVSQSTVSRCVTEVTEAINNPQIFNAWVQFPDTFQKFNIIRQEFAEQGFPGVIGCVVCTHVAIFPPNIDDPEYPEHVYINRKNYHSINVQLICDCNLKIINVNAKYPGSTNYAYIWNQSNAQTVMRNLHLGGHTDYFLLGDSGYPLRTWLLTPLNEDTEPNTPQHNYNIAHKSTRSKIERCNGVFKSRFRCLLKHRVLHYKPIVTCKIINACVVLHNMCIDHNVPELDLFDAEANVNINYGLINEADEEEGNNVVRMVNPELAAGRAARNRIIQIFRRNR